jgi:aspartate-semialdehyde dehydrogenase
MVAALPLKALHDAFGLTGLTATSLQAASGAGQAGADELEAQLETLLAQREMLYTDGAGAAASVGHDVHAAPLAFNAVPMIGDEADDGTTAEEAKLANESRKILDLPELAVAPTCVRVPVMVGHAVAVRASFADRVGVANAVSSMTGFPGMALVDVPTPLEWAGRDEVAVGRIRADAEDPHVLSFFVVGDNLRKGAALNTVQLAELAVQRDLA